MKEEEEEELGLAEFFRRIDSGELTVRLASD